MRVLTLALMIDGGSGTIGYLTRAWLTPLPLLTYPDSAVHLFSPVKSYCVAEMP